MEESLKDISTIKNYERFSAIDGRKAKFTDIQTDESFTGQDVFDKKIILNKKYKIQCSEETEILFNGVNQTEYNKRLPGEIGITCSHKQLWQKVLHNNIQNTLIMEDDENFIFFGNWFFKAALHNVPKDFELLQLHHAFFGRVYVDNINDSYLYKQFQFYNRKYFQYLFWKQAKRNVNSTRSYIITPEAAKKLLQCQQEYSKEPFIHIDVTMMKCIEDKSIITYLSKPMFVVNNEELDNQSEINNLN